MKLNKIYRISINKHGILPKIQIMQSGRWEEIFQFEKHCLFRVFHLTLDSRSNLL